MDDVRWIDLDGAANVRDLGGLPTTDGRAVQPDRLIRADNLQGLSARDVRRLVDRHGVRSVADLRSEVEVGLEGPGPMTREPLVAVQNLSLFPEAGEHTDVAADGEDAPVVLPWQTRDAAQDAERGAERDAERGAEGDAEGDAERDAEGGAEQDAGRRGLAAIYLRYLDDRADSVIAALRLIAATDGATVVHCAAGKDRTGVVVAFALAEVGVTRDAIIADYARSAERIEAIFDRLRGTRTYRDDIGSESIDKHKPRAVTMERLLDTMDALHGGIPAWLRAHGWTDDDAAALQKRLLE